MYYYIATGVLDITVTCIIRLEYGNINSGNFLKYVMYVTPFGHAGL